MRPSCSCLSSARENGIAFGKYQQLAWFSPLPVLIAQRLGGHDVSSFIWIYYLCQIDRQVLATKFDNFVWRLTQQVMKSKVPCAVVVYEQVFAITKYQIQRS